MPPLIDLAATSLLIAVKLEEDASPSFSNMSALLDELHKIKVQKQQFIDLEEQVVRRLNFDL